MWVAVSAKLCTRTELRYSLTIDDYADALEFLAAKTKAEAEAAKAAQANMPQMGRR